MTNITTLPSTYYEVNGFSNCDNLKNENGEASAMVTNGQSEYVQLNFTLPSSVRSGNTFMYWTITGTPTLNFQCKSSRSSTNLYKTRPYISRISYYHNANSQRVTHRDVGWYGSQTNGTNWKNYQYQDPNGLPFAANNPNFIIYDVPNPSILITIGVNKYYGSLADTVSLRNCKLTIPYRWIGFINFYFESEFVLSDDITSQNFFEGDSVVIPKPQDRNGYTFDGWWTAFDGGTKLFNGGETHTFTRGQNRMYAHFKPASKTYSGIRKVNGVYRGTGLLRSTYVGTTKVC